MHKPKRSLYAVCGLLVAMACSQQTGPVAPTDEAGPLAPAGADITVDDDGAQCPGAQFTSIQAAIDAAAPGQEILVCPGLYNEVVNVDRTLILRGKSDGKACEVTPVPTKQTIIDGPDGGFPPAVTISANNVVFEGFTIQGTGNAGMYIVPASSGHLIRKNQFRDNTFGLYLHSSGAATTNVQENCFYQNNRPGAASGNGIYSDQGLANARIANNLFQENQSSAMVLTRFVPGLNTGITIEGNKSTLDGSLLALFLTTNSLVQGNVALQHQGSGIFVGNDNSLVTFRDNEMTSGTGRGISTSIAFGGGPSSDLTFTGNKVKYSMNDGMRVGDGSLQNSTISKNQFQQSGDDGLQIQAGNAGNTILENDLKQNPTHDCHDSNALGTNTWTKNKGLTQNQAGLCPGAAVTLPPAHS